MRGSLVHVVVAGRLESFDSGRLRSHRLTLEQVFVLSAAEVLTVAGVSFKIIEALTIRRQG